MSNWSNYYSADYFSRDQVFTICKVLDAIEEEEEFNDVAGIAIEPLEVRTETNEDSGDEEFDPHRLTGSLAFDCELERICSEKIAILVPTIQMMKLKLRRLKLL